MTKVFQPTAHPVLALPSMAEAVALGAEGFRELMLRREKIIAEERHDPFGKGWEPPIWRVCDALLGLPWVEPGWAAAMRKRLGFDKPVQVLLINGGNRAGKSEWASKRVMRILRLRERARAWALHSKDRMSIDYQQPLFWKYMDPQLKGKEIRTTTTYVAYKQKTGFSDGKFVLPNRSDLSFLNYEMDRDTIEGGNLDVIWNDELVPPDWVETQELRVAEKSGWVLVTFTPVNGYNETCRLFQDGADVTAEMTAFLCPKDGGLPDVARALGLDAEEFAELIEAEREKRAARFPQSRPQECGEWLTGGTGQPAVPEGREFEKLPRVMRCAGGEGKRAVVFFTSADNPYGNPKGVWAFVANKAQEFIKERFYGFASKALSSRFPKFDLHVHVIAPDQVPRLGTNYHKVDPSSGRNFFMLWFRVTPEGVYVYREWPGNYYIPGVGVPGPWAVPDGKKMDGRPGPGQAPFGFGNIRYKLELARLERWTEYEVFAREQGQIGDRGQLSAEQLKEVGLWDELNGAREVIDRREIDSRFASVPKNENDRPTTLLTDFENIQVYFEPAPAGEINEGIQLINDALDYDPGKPVDFFNKPRLLISSECQNLIYALRSWTGQDGQKGATKDPVDVLRWFFQGENAYVGAAEERGQEAKAEKGIERFLGEDYDKEGAQSY